MLLSKAFIRELFTNKFYPYGKQTRNKRKSMDT